MGFQTVRFELYYSNLQFNIRIGRHLAFMVVSLPVLNFRGVSRRVFRTLSNAYDDVSLAEVVNVFQQFTILQKAPL